MPFPAAYTPNMRPMKAHWSRRSILDGVPDQYQRMMHLQRHIRFITPDYMYLDSSTMPFPAAYTPNMRSMKAHWSRRSIPDGVPDQYSRMMHLERHIRFITPDYMYLDSSAMPFPAAYTPNMRPMKAHWSRRSILDGVPDQYSRTTELLTPTAPYSIHMFDDERLFR